MGQYTEPADQHAQVRRNPRQRGRDVLPAEVEAEVGDPDGEEDAALEGTEADVVGVLRHCSSPPAEGTPRSSPSWTLSLPSRRRKTTRRRSVWRRERSRE